MDIRVEQQCPQCGGTLTISETDRLLHCSYCGVRNFMQSTGVFRYYLPPLSPADGAVDLLYAPYLRFKGNIFLVNESGISHKVLDTTQLGFDLDGLPPSLGIRPQTMQLKRLLPDTAGRFLRQTSKAQVVLEKAMRLTPLRVEKRKHERTYQDGEVISIGSRIETVEYSSHSHFLHRAFIGETISVVYLPLGFTENEIVDGVSGNHLLNREQAVGVPLRGTPFNPRWQVHFMSTLCPGCLG